MTIDVSSGALFLALGGTLTGMIGWFLATMKRVNDDALADLDKRVATLEERHHLLHTRLEVLVALGDDRRPNA